MIRCLSLPCFGNAAATTRHSRRPFHTSLRRYRTANSSEDEFNVDALLKTTTGMTMENLRQNMANLRSTRRKRALGASLDLVLSQFPSEDHVRDPCSKSNGATRTHSCRFAVRSTCT